MCSQASLSGQLSTSSSAETEYDKKDGVVRIISVKKAKANLIGTSRMILTHPTHIIQLRRNCKIIFSKGAKQREILSPCKRLFVL